LARGEEDYDEVESGIESELDELSDCSFERLILLSEMHYMLAAVRSEAQTFCNEPDYCFTISQKLSYAN